MRAAKVLEYQVMLGGRVGLPELIIILLIVILIFGANRLPELGKSIGKGIRNFKDATKDGEDDKS
jgi:sec-independent protein translocase protein TatA